MTSSIPRAPTSSPSVHDDEAFPQPPLFADYPLMFVLPTRLSLEDLHTLEDELARFGATLTYDVSEARIFLGTISQRKRAALELRVRGVWTEDVEVVASSVVGSGAVGTVGAAGKRGKALGSESESSTPSAKRRRLASSKGEGWSQHDPVDLSSTESESAGADTESRAPSPLRRHKMPSPSASSVSTIETETQTQREQDAIVPENHVKVVKLEWITQSIKARRALDIDQYVVYHGKVVARPQDPNSAKKHTPISSVKKDSEGILARAIGDAASRPAPSSQSSYTSRFASSSRHKGGDSSQQQYHPPTLYRQSTSEHDATILIPPAPDWVKDRVMYACMRSAPLHPPNEAFIAQLVKIRKVRELTLDEIGVRAYSTSIAALAAYPYELRTPVEVLSLPGCDTKIANLFVEFRNSADGKLEAANVLDSDPVISTIHQFYNIWGVGAKTARDFYYQRQWRDLDDVIEHGWNNLSRVQQIGLKYYDEFLAGIPRAEVTEIAKTIHRHANQVRPGCDYDGQGIECIIVGGYRRGKEISGDIDLVLSHRDERVTKDLVLDVVGSLESEGWITHTLALHMTTSNREQQTLPFRGDPDAHHFDSLDKALVVWQDPNFEVVTNNNTGGEDEAQAEPVKNTNPHRRVDIIISPWRTVGCAVLGWSGDTTFERDLRRYAKKAHGWKFDSSGVRERTSGGHVIDLEKGGRTWEERERLVMEGLGVGWRPASERCTR